MKAVYIHNDVLFLFADGRSDRVGGIEDVGGNREALRAMAERFAEQMGFDFIEEQDIPAELRIVA